MAQQVMESSFSPSAPPRNYQNASLRAGPPTYDAVLDQDPAARRNAAEVQARGFTGSLAYAGN